MNKKIDLLGKLLRRKERQEEQVKIKTAKRRKQKKFAKKNAQRQRRNKA